MIHSYTVLAALLLGLPHDVLAQATPDLVIRGRVTTDSGVPLAGASVLIIQRSDQRFRSATTDTAGRYQLVWPAGTGVYTVRISAPGRHTLQTEVRRTGGDTVLVVDAKLATQAPVSLAPVTVVGTTLRPDRTPPNGAESGASEVLSFVPNAARRLPPDLTGDLSAISALANPAALPTPGGVSVFGLPAGQNSIVLNGMAFPGAVLPSAASAATRSSSTSYDPANGWFSGQRTNVHLVTGGLFTTWTSHLSLDLPQTQAADPVASQLGQRFTDLDLALGGDGRLLDDRLAYNVSVQGSHKDAAVSSLLTADADVLQHAGIAPDSVTHLRQVLGQAAIPTTTAGVPGALTTDNVVFLGRLDHTPYDWNTMTAARTTWGLTGYGFWNQAQAQGMGPTATPAHAGTTVRTAGALQAEYSSYFGRDYLADLRTGVTYAGSVSTPYLRLPDAHVRVVSDLPSSTGGVAQLAFGGNSGLNSELRNWTWESTAEFQLHPPGAHRHRVKLNADLRYDRVSLSSGANTLGSLVYGSLADLAANAPSSYTRVLNAPTRTGAAWNGYLSVGDLWRASPSLQVLGGVRLEGNAFDGRPPYNPLVDSLFGQRTDFAPNTAHLSPRLGFTWNHFNANGRPTGTIRGGIGEFRNLMDPGLLAAPSVMTGLPGGDTRLACVGAAVPTPDWTAWIADPATIPRQCAPGGVSLSDDAPPVQLVTRGYTAERSWRANLSWSSGWHGNAYTLLGTWSANRDQHGTRDLNFNDAAAFTTPEGRPVFADTSSVVSGSGVVGAAGARRFAAFGRVLAGVADLRSESHQLTLILRPALRLGQRLGDPQVAYTYSVSRTLARGLDAPTFGTPAAAEWARSDLDARHQIQIQAVFRPLGNADLLLFAYGRLQSGLPYTPMVATDVNGDGLANDRAYIFDPGTLSDAALSAGLRSLLVAAPAPARRCLSAQVGQPAGRNSCEGPWTTALNLSLRVSGQSLLHAPRLDLTVNFANPLSGLDELLHGAANLHGWGGSAAPDPTLYTVRGFDPQTKQFLYQVNPRFGATQPGTTIQRAPFRMTVSASLDLGRPLPAQELHRWLSPGRNGHPGERVSANDLRRRLERQVPDPYLELLAQPDSLLLSPQQATALRQVDARYAAHMDSIWTALASSLAELPDQFDAGVAYRAMDAGIDDAWEITRLDVHQELPVILTPEQLATLGGWAGQLWRAPSRVHIRLFTGG